MPCAQPLKTGGQTAPPCAQSRTAEAGRAHGAGRAAATSPWSSGRAPRPEGRARGAEGAPSAPSGQIWRPVCAGSGRNILARSCWPAAVLPSPTMRDVSAWHDVASRRDVRRMRVGAAWGRGVDRPDDRRHRIVGDPAAVRPLQRERLLRDPDLKEIPPTEAGGATCGRSGSSWGRVEGRSSHQTTRTIKIDPLRYMP